MGVLQAMCRKTGCVAMILLLLFVAFASCTPLQYCRVDESLRTDQCLGILTYQNSTTKANDMYLVMSAKFEKRRGFAAFGTGQRMDGALIFAMYPGHKEGDVTVSLRTTNYHDPPEMSNSIPDYTVLRRWVDGAYHNVQLVCYACDQWTRNAVNFASNKQAWIFSNNNAYKMQSDDVNKSLVLHTDYNQFELDMTVSYHRDGTPRPPELVENGRKSVGAQKSSSLTPPQLFAIHGLLLSFAFVILMPFGISGIRSKHGKGFKLHWCIQLCAVVIALMGMCLAIYITWGHPIQIGTLNGLHKTAGGILFVSLMATPMMGYLHHLRYLKLHRATSITVWHRCFGSSTLLVAWVNILLGLNIAGQSVWYSTLAVVFMVLGSVLMYSAATISRRIQKRQIGAPKFVVQSDEDDSDEEFLLEDKQQAQA